MRTRKLQLLEEYDKTFVAELLEKDSLVVGLLLEPFGLPAEAMYCSILKCE
ncbi:hypothetical protein [Enterocloster lavalensis]|uniref:hypothetical protein n=1 Tax=Enterocloster lavalensis TaxID=460384 RepID=UPI002665506F|nr:hypothetical protein [Enterocloster lavalensis]